MALRKSQLEHMLLIRSLVRRLKASGFRNVQADLKGLAGPGKLRHAFEEHAFVPDVTGVGTEYNVFEVETEDSIYDDHTAQQWPKLAEHAEGRNGRFWVVVPKGAGEDARSRLARLRVQGGVLEI